MPCRRTAVLAGMLMVGCPAMAQTLDTKGATSCSVQGFATDRDPKGSNLRSAPRADAPIIGHVPPRFNIGGNDWTGLELKIEGSKDGWLLVHDDSPNPSMTFDAARASDRRGWLSARLVSTTLRFPPLRSAPRRDAPVIVQMKGDDWGPDSITASAVHGCQGEYIEVTAAPMHGKPVRGWTFKGCAMQLTTCDSGGMTE
jgi:hypothetical protein